MNAMHDLLLLSRGAGEKNDDNSCSSSSNIDNSQSPGQKTIPADLAHPLPVFQSSSSRYPANPDPRQESSSSPPKFPHLLITLSDQISAPVERCQTDFRILCDRSIEDRSIKSG